MVSPTYHIIAPVLCSGNTFELAERNSMPSDGAEELLKALHKWYIRRRVCQLQQCNGRLSSKEIKGSDTRKSTSVRRLCRNWQESNSWCRSTPRNIFMQKLSGLWYTDNDSSWWWVHRHAITAWSVLYQNALSPPSLGLSSSLPSSPPPYLPHPPPRTVSLTPSFSVHDMTTQGQEGKMVRNSDRVSRLCDLKTEHLSQLIQPEVLFSKVASSRNLCLSCALQPQTNTNPGVKHCTATHHSGGKSQRQITAVQRTFLMTFNLVIQQIQVFDGSIESSAFENSLWLLHSFQHRLNHRKKHNVLVSHKCNAPLHLWKKALPKLAKFLVSISQNSHFSNFSSL